MSATEHDKKSFIKQWAFDTRPVLRRFHLWLEDVDVEWEEGERSLDYTFAPRGIRRSLAMTSAVTALGTKLFGQFGEGKGKDKQEFNQVKKAADAVSAYIMSEGLWYLTRSLPENHALMVCLGEGLMPKAGETPEMGSNPLLGFGRVYARPLLAKFIDKMVHKLLNDPAEKFEDFYRIMRANNVTIWGAAVDTLENTSRFAKGEETGPMAVFHLFNQPLTVSKPYEAYMGTLAIPKKVKKTAEDHSILVDFLTPRELVAKAIDLTYPGIKRQNIHVWTLGGKSREERLGGLWKEWRDQGVHLVEDGWITPTGMPAFSESGTYAPTYLVRDWNDDQGDTHVFLCDGYAATAEAMQAGSLSKVLDVDVSMVLYSPKFNLSHRDEYKLMKLSPEDETFGQKLGELFGKELDQETIDYYKGAILDAYDANMPVNKRVLTADDFFPEKKWRVLATDGYMSPDPYTGTSGVTQVGERSYQVVSRLATRKVSIKITFVLKLMDDFDESRLVFSPLLIRLISDEDYKTRAVKVSDSGRIRNELQTLMSQALEYRGESIRVHFDRLDDRVIPFERQEKIKEILKWYSENHPMWFNWLEVV